MEEKITFKPYLIPENRPPFRPRDMLTVMSKVLGLRVFRGNSIKAFERELADFVGVKHAISFSTGRYALTKLFEYYGCKGKKVVMPAYTCIPALDSIRWAGAEPLFMDISLETYNMKFDEKLNDDKDIGAIMLTYLYGIAGEIRPFLEFAKKRGIPIIEDSAIALGAEYDGKKVGSIGNAAIFSLQSSKIITGWRGGVVVTDDDKLAEWLRTEQKKLRQRKFSELLFYIKYTFFHYFFSVPWLYGMTVNPIKSFFLKRGRIGEAVSGKSPEKMPSQMATRFTNIQAALAINGLRRIDELIKKRRKIAKIYFDTLEGIKNVYVPKELKNSKNVYGRFPVIIDSITKQQAHTFFFKHNIQVGLNYPYICPLTQHIKKSYSGSEFPNALKSAEQTFLLPMYDSLTELQAKKIVKVMKFCLKQD